MYVCALNTTWPRFCKNYALRFSMLDETGFYAPSMDNLAAAGTHSFNGHGTTAHNRDMLVL